MAIGLSATGSGAPAGRPRASLRRQLLIVLTALTVPLLIVGALGGLLLRSAAADYQRSSERVQAAASASDLQTKVAALTSALTKRELFEGEPGALMVLLSSTGDVEQAFTSLRSRVQGGERVGVDQAYQQWQQLLVTIAELPAKLPVLRRDVDALLDTLDDLGPRSLSLAQVLDEASGGNAQALDAELRATHDRQRVWILELIGLALVGLGAAVLTAHWLHRRITHPLVALQEAAQQLGAHNLDQRVVADRTPELGALARAFNQMADRLQDSQTQLSDREQRFRALVQHASDVVAVVDASSLVTYVTASARRVLDVSAEDLCGQRLLDLVHPEDQQLVAGVLDTAASDRDATQTVACRLRAGPAQDDAWRHAELVVSNLCDVPAVAGLVVTARDVTEQTRLDEELRHCALHDELTGLPNRALFADRLEHALAGREQVATAVLYGDLDDFKSVNDTLGHAAGDALLVAVAQRLNGGLRARDTAARFGGDEFAVLLEGVDLTQARETAERLRDVVGERLVLDGIELFPQISIGVAIGSAGGPEELLRQADTAMYQAKRQGRRRVTSDVVVFDSRLAAEGLARLELKADLHRALPAGQFLLHYQPIVHLATGEVTGVEALLRWRHPTRGDVSPLDFIPLAEETGVILKLGLWVLETACAQVRTWQLSYPEHPLRLNVNLSGRQLEHPDIVSDVASVLAMTGLDPGLLTLEITESVLLDGAEEIVGRLHGLKALGLRLAIDDFGTGYSSLSYLQRLPIDVLKIDKTFVDALADLGAGETRDALAATIVQLARTLGLGSVAEGIEHTGQADALRVLGCEVGQGYLFARPLPPTALQALLEPGAPPLRMPEPSRQS